MVEVTDKEDTWAIKTNIMTGTITQQNKELLSRMIVNEFNQIDFSTDYIYGKADELINLSSELGLSELANQLTIDKEII